MQFFTGIGNPAKAQAFLHKTNQCYGAGPFLVGDSYKFRLKFVRLNSFIEGTMSRDFRLFLGKKKLYLNRQKRFHFFSFFSKIFMKKGRKKVEKLVTLSLHELLTVKIMKICLRRKT